MKLNTIIKYYALLIFAVILFLPSMSKHNAHLKIFYDSPQYAISTIFLIISAYISQIYRWKNDPEFKEWFLKNFNAIILLSFLAASLLSLYFAWEAIQDHDFLTQAN